MIKTNVPARRLFLDAGRKYLPFFMGKLDKFTRMPYNKDKQREKQGGQPASGDCSSPRCRHETAKEGGRVRWASVSTPWETTWKTSYRRNDRIGDEKADAVILHCAPKKSSRRRRLIGMGASTPSRARRDRRWGAANLSEGASCHHRRAQVIGMGASTPSRARRDRRWGAAKTICRRKELTEV